MPLFVALFTLLAIAFETAEQTCFKAASAARRKLTFTAIGMALNLAGMACLLLVLRHAPLGLVVPLLASTNITVALAGAALFKEKITPRRWLGILLITAGVAIVSANFHD